MKRYAEALTLIQHGALHIREARQALSLLPPSPNDEAQTEDPINSNDPQQPSFYTLTSSDVALLDDELSADSLQCKKDWFTFNGGQATSESTSNKAHKKPLFFDVALNYVQLDMERLQERAGNLPTPAAADHSETPRKATISGAKDVPVPQEQQRQVEAEKKTTLVGKTLKVEALERERAPTPEPGAQSARGGLGSLLGGWWGRK